MIEYPKFKDMTMASMRNFCFIAFIVLLNNCSVMSQDVKESIFRGVKTSTGYTWTITTRLGDMLKVATELYGPRDITYTKLGVELIERPKPQIWYPGNTTNVAIQITQSCQFNMSAAIYEVAHETIHCMMPHPGLSANVLEEGVATYFAIYYSNTIMGENRTVEEQSYKFAYEAVEKLLKVKATAISDIRKIQPNLSLITKDILLTTVPQIDSTLSINLLKNFNELSF